VEPQLFLAGSLSRSPGCAAAFTLTLATVANAVGWALCLCIVDAGPGQSAPQGLQELAARGRLQNAPQSDHKVITFKVILISILRSLINVSQHMLKTKRDACSTTGRPKYRAQADT
jgi:hypothetical protein